MDIEQRITQLGLVIPTPPKPLASYIPSLIVHGSPPLLYVSGQIPLKGGAPIATGHVGETVTIDQAKACAAQCALNGIAAAKGALEGDLSRIDRVVRLGGFVACGGSFTEHPAVINGASDLMEQIFADKGKHVRAAVGVPSLPLGVPVEIEFLFALKG